MMSLELGYRDSRQTVWELETEKASKAVGILYESCFNSK
jgi:hypothetical protein